VSERYDFVCALIASAISPLIVIFLGVGANLVMSQPKIAFWSLLWFLISIMGTVLIVRLVLFLLKPTILSRLGRSAKQK